MDENFQEITAFFSEYTAQIIFLLPDLFLIEHTVFTIKQTSKSYVLCIVVGLNARGCHMCLALICAKPLFTEKCRYMPLQTAYTTKFPSTKVFLFSQYLLISQKKKKLSDYLHFPFCSGYVFAVSVHRVQLLLQVLNVKRFHHQQQQQQQTPQNNGQEELTVPEISEICDYFSRRVASEPYDASRVASFITLLTLPISVLREFIKLIAWKKSLPQAHADNATTHRARIEICLEKHPRLVSDDYTASSSSSKSNIHHDRANNSVDFALTFVLDQALVPHMSISGGAAWLPYCVSVRVRYTFGEDSHIAFLAMDGSHSGRACWLQHEDWERCKQRVSRAVETMNGSAAVGDMSQGRLRMVAEMVQKQLQLSLLQLRDSPVSTGSAAS